jgi:hypothetical protein
MWWVLSVMVCSPLTAGCTWMDRFPAFANETDCVLGAYAYARQPDVQFRCASKRIPLPRMRPAALGRPRVKARTKEAPAAGKCLWPWLDCG